MDIERCRLRHYAMMQYLMEETTAYVEVASLREALNNCDHHAIKLLIQHPNLTKEGLTT